MSGTQHPLPQYVFMAWLPCLPFNTWQLTSWPLQRCLLPYTKMASQQQQVQCFLGGGVSWDKMCDYSSEPAPNNTFGRPHMMRNAQHVCRDTAPIVRCDCPSGCSNATAQLGGISISLRHLPC